MAELNGNKNGFAVHVRGVSKTFGKGEARTPALKGVDFDARLGELLMIVGPSGCGKTTLLSVIAGTLEFEGGEIDVFDTSLHGLTNRQVTDFRKRNVGFIFQQFNLIPTLSLVENVSVPLLINGERRGIAEKKARALLDQLGLQGRGNDRPTNLWADSNSAWPSPARWCMSRVWSFATSQLRRSTKTPARKSWNCCAKSRVIPTAVSSW